MAEPEGIPAGEVKRKIVHIAVGCFAFLLRELTWPQAAAMALSAFLFNWQVLPRVGGKALWRGHEAEKGYPLGILLYPLSVLALVLLFRDELWKAAAVWALLAFGDGMASLVGLSVSGPRLFFNPRKGWAGFVAFVVFGAVGATILALWTRKLPMGSAGSATVLAVFVPLAVLCAIVEAAPTTLDDNLTVPLAGAVLLPLLGAARWETLLSREGALGLLGLGLAVNTALALAAWVASAIDLPGGLSAILIGTAITVGTGVCGLLVMVAFFVLGSVATRIGYEKKAARGIAQERGGARGWRNAWANGGVPAFLALLAGATPEPFLLVVAYAASVATAAADTCSSEFGKAFGRRTFLITTLRAVPPGTEGAVSLEGTLAGFLGAAAVAVLGSACGLYSPQVALLIAAAGLFGALAESVLGTVAERRGWLDNDSLNFVNTAMGGAFAVCMVRLF